MKEMPKHTRFTWLNTAVNEKGRLINCGLLVIGLAQTLHGKIGFLTTLERKEDSHDQQRGGEGRGV